VSRFLFVLCTEPFFTFTSFITFSIPVFKEGQTNSDKKKSKVRSILAQSNCTSISLDKFKKNIHPIITLPKHIRTDIRKVYTEIFSNVLNSHVFNMLFGFVDHFCSHDVLQVNNKCTPENERSVSYVRGATSIASYFHTMHQLAPDSVQLIHHSDMHLSFNSHKSKTVSRFSVRLTRIFEMGDNDIVKRSQNVMPVDRHSQSLVGTKRNSLNHPNPNVEKQLNEVQSSIDRLQSQLVPKEVPTVINLNGTMTFYTNEDCKVNKMVFEMDPNVLNVCC
jgi:hypothetical protein